MEDLAGLASLADQLAARRPLEALVRQPGAVAVERASAARRAHLLAEETPALLGSEVHGLRARRQLAADPELLGRAVAAVAELEHWVDKGFST